MVHILAVEVDRQRLGYRKRKRKRKKKCDVSGGGGGGVEGNEICKLKNLTQV